MKGKNGMRMLPLIKLTQKSYYSGVPYSTPAIVNVESICYIQDSTILFNNGEHMTVVEDYNTIIDRIRTAYGTETVI